MPVCDTCKHARSKHVEYSGPDHDTYWGACTRGCGCKEYRNAAADLAERTQDAHSYDRYGQTRWTRLIARFLTAQYSARQTEAIMRSKWTRWAMDACGWRASSLELYLYIEPRLSQAEVDALVEGTFR